MTDPQSATIADLFRLMTEVRDRIDSVDRRLEAIEQDRLMHRQRMQAVEQHAAVFVEHSANINRRLDDLAERMDRMEKQPAR